MSAPRSERPNRGSRHLRLSLLCIAVVALAGETILGIVYSRDIGEIAVSLALFLLVACAGVVSFWLAMRSFAKPLGAIESAIQAFANGEGAESSEGRLPKDGPLGLGFIATEIGDLMSRIRGWRRELEDQVAVRTFELEFRNALLRAVSAAKGDEEAYSAVVAVIISFFAADSVLFAYYDGARNLQAASLRSPPPAHGQAPEEKTGSPSPMLASLEPGQARLLERAASGLEIELPFLGEGSSSTLVLALESQGDNAGYVALTRRDKPFEKEERKLLVNIFSAFANQVYMRKNWSRQEHIQQEAEKALRRSEERLRAFFEESKDMIYSANADDIVASINAAGMALLGVEDRFEVVGRPISNYMVSTEERRYFLAKLREQGFAMDYECVFKKKDGSTVFCIETAHAVKDKEGRIIEIQGIVKDISERIANERELWKTNLELAETNAKLKSTQMLMVQHEKLASIGQLAAGIAHEINNPLGFLKSNQSTLEGFLGAMRLAWEEAAEAFPEKLSEIGERHDLAYVFDETRALLAESDEGFERIIDIVKNLKSFSRIDANPVMGPYDLNKGIESSLVVARNEYKYCAVVDLDLGEIPPIRAAGGEINQVILNMVVNSAQAIESQKRSEKGRILITTRLEGDWAVLDIEDDGPGIPPEKRMRVFDPFYTTKEPGKGTGLGLSISYDIVVRKHGGTLTLHDSRMGGALFRVTLPLERPPGAVDAALTPEA